MPPWHVSNRLLVQLPVFWETAILICRLLRTELYDRYEENKIQTDVPWSVDGIALNFGRWETAGATDTGAIECHGHAHVLLSLHFIEQCDDSFFRTLKGRQEPNQNYCRANAEQMERDRLLSAEMKQHRVEMNRLNEKMDKTERRIENVLSYLQEFVGSREF
ncbi:unnamed protein product [Didymodactylos carnosus]|uniref:Uncharacterized protein n=1 Tax=Didymodactylos carnosus TaxID=1234261 RepID=A0A8S2F678_9BILA|nr:unnamed protein product [Didymodactylos carnosus]CAF4165444.1 unnamed protein product [Didymodactylos carnosus]